MNILIPREVLAKVISHALGEDPEECCGVLLGRKTNVEKVIKTKNVSAEKIDRYTIDPKDMAKAQDTADRDGLDIVGFYHSHTYTQGYPSDTDVKNAVETGWTDLSYVIISLVEKTRPVVRAFLINDDGTVSEQVIKTDGKAYRGPTR